MSEVAFAAAACRLAKDIFRARLRAYDLSVVQWEQLDTSTRHFYVRQAGDILKANCPPGPFQQTSPLFDAFAAHTRRAFSVVRSHD